MTWLATAAVIATVSACGSSSPSSISSTLSTAPRSARTGTSRAGGLSVSAVERALVARGSPPAPTRATCHPASTPERASSPFGPTNLPVFVCTLILRGKLASYAVQVQRNGCFVAERRGGGRAVYGCGIARP